MKFIDGDETKKWLQTNELLEENGATSIGKPSHSWRYSIPADSGKKTVLSRSISSLFVHRGQSLLWVHEYGIWPSCEDRVLFDGFRMSLGERRPVQQCPGHLFLSEDLPYCGSILAMILYFVWGAIVVSSDRQILVEISHDEILEIHVRDALVQSGQVDEIMAGIERIVGTRSVAHSGSNK